MKRIFIIFLALVMTSITTRVFADNEYPITFEQLPVLAQTFVKNHFPSAQISYCIKESRGYEVRFADATEIEFTKTGAWKDVDCKYSTVPESILKLIPASIPTYIKSVLPSTVITQVKIDGRRYELKLNTGLELEFNRSGAIIRMDD
ncbi:MAG: PepSY-like domain-containing protein [Alistipes sp.]|nr:PepSY-like domain-containing protein [Candidatus Alistipes equi]